MLAKLTTLIIVATLITYSLVFYSGTINQFNPFNKSTPTPTQEAQISPTATLTPSPSNNEKCLITLDGIEYDVTFYRDLHSGGDIFKCGTDMTALFHKRHPNVAKYLEIMAKYKI